MLVVPSARMRWTVVLSATSSPDTSTVPFPEAVELVAMSMGNWPWMFTPAKVMVASTPGATRMPVATAVPDPAVLRTV